LLTASKGFVPLLLKCTIFVLSLYISLVLSRFSYGWPLFVRLRFGKLTLQTGFKETVLAKAESLKSTLSSKQP